MRNKKWTADYQETESNFLGTYPLKIKSDVVPNLDIDGFAGKINLYDGLGILERPIKKPKTALEKENNKQPKDPVKGFLAMEEGSVEFLPEKG
jgi:hypothetical protein